MLAESVGELVKTLKNKNVILIVWSINILKYGYFLSIPDIKGREVQLQEEIKSTIEDKLQHLLSHSNVMQIDNTGRADQKISKLSAEKLNFLKEDLEVEFEQPPLSITNHNFKLDEYNLLQQEDSSKCDEEEIKKC